MLDALEVNGLHAEKLGALDVQFSVVNEDTFIGRGLSDLECATIDLAPRLAQAEITRAEEILEVVAQVKSFDAVEIQLTRFVVERGHPEAARPGQGGEDGEGLRLHLRLAEHELAEVFAREVAAAVEDHPVEIFVEGETAFFKFAVNKLVPLIEFLFREGVLLDGPFSGFGAPGV